MSKVYKQADGSFTPHPITREHAALIGSRLYLTDTKCEVCNSSNLRFTKSNNCIMCQRFKIELTRIYCNHVEGGEDSYLPDSIPNGLINKTIADEVKIHVSHIKDGGTLHYDPCKTYGHVRISGADGTYCLACKATVGAYDQAVIDGVDTYVSTSKCPDCKDITVRNTHDKSCTKCGYVKHVGVATETPDTVMMREAPDMIVSKVDAVAMGLKVYRTGKACKNGHTGFRYVSTGNCIDCIKS